MSRISMILTLLFSLILISCNAYQVTPLDISQNGSLFASSQASYSCRAGALGSTDGCIGAQLGQKTGQACHYTILSLISFGDKSVSKAMQEGGVSKVGLIDYSDLSILRITNLVPYWAWGINFSLFNRECVIVNGN